MSRVDVAQAFFSSWGKIYTSFGMQLGFDR